MNAMSVDKQPNWFQVFTDLDEAVAERYLGYSADDLNDAIQAGLTVDETVAMLQDRYKDRDEAPDVSDMARKAAQVRKVVETEDEGD